MNEALLLSDEEISAVTGYRKPALQVRELQLLGFVRARVNVLNRVILERVHFEAVCSSAAASEVARTPSRPQVQAPRSSTRRLPR
jgi:hypothetical protein